MDEKHTPTPDEFAAANRRYVYRDGKGKETVQWREAALNLSATNAALVEALQTIAAQVGPNTVSRPSELAVAMAERARAALKLAGVQS